MGLKFDFMILSLKKSFEIYDNKFSMNPAEKVKACLAYKVIIFLCPERIRQLLYGFKTVFYEFQYEKFHRNLRKKKSSIKIAENFKGNSKVFGFLVHYKNNKLLWCSASKKPILLIYTLENSFVIYVQRN